MRTYLSLKVYINSLVPNPRGPNSSESLRNFHECLELDTPGPSAASLLVSLLTPSAPGVGVFARIPLCIARHSLSVRMRACDDVQK